MQKIKPGRYKPKQCPTCGIIHKGRGMYCSTACSNKGREVTDETRQKLSQNKHEYMQTPEGIANMKLMNKKREQQLENDEKAKRGEYVLQEDDWYVVPYGEPDEDDGVHL